MHCLQLTHSMYQILNPRVFYYKVLFSPTTCSFNHIPTTMLLVVSCTIEIFPNVFLRGKSGLFLSFHFSLSFKSEFRDLCVSLSPNAHTPCAGTPRRHRYQHKKKQANEIRAATDPVKAPQQTPKASRPPSDAR
jgi:hypothetical protein